MARFSYRFKVIVAICMLACIAAANAADRQQLPMNIGGKPMFDATGRPIYYDWKSLGVMGHAHTARKRSDMTRGPLGFVPSTANDEQRFWQYAVFGEDIGASNIVIAPPPTDGRPPEILVGGKSSTSLGSFWQSIRYNPTTGTYDCVFVSPIFTNGIYPATISRIGLANVTTTAEKQIVVMLQDGRIYLYDFATKAELGYFNAGIFYDLYGLSLADLDGDGLSELIVTTSDNLYVFNGSGQLLWQVAGAGGYDVVVGTMDRRGALKIAATNGKVVDALTHAVVWTNSNGFGYTLKLAPLPGTNYQQLIAGVGQDVVAYDVAFQLQRWSIPMQTVEAIQVADMDADGVPEVLVGDTSGGGSSVHVYDLVTQALKWQVSSWDSGVSNIAVSDVDGDSIVELLWGAGSDSSGPDHFNVTSSVGSHALKWQSVSLDGPFLGPAIGDLDGDGQPELVISSTKCDANYTSGRILVFDLGTLTLRGISQPIADNYSAYGIQDLKLRDVNGDGRMEIVIGADYSYNSVIEVYRFDSNNTFTRIWTNGTRPFNSQFTFVDVADLDNNGTRKIIGTNRIGGSPTDGVHVYVYDYPSGIESWRSALLRGGSGAGNGLLVQDLNGDGNKEIAVLVGDNYGTNGDLYTWDGPTRQLQNLRQNTGLLLSNRATASGLILGDNTGTGHFLQYGTSSYSETFARQLGTGALSGINIGPAGELWTGNATALTLRVAPSYSNVVWQTPAISDRFGRFVATDSRDGQSRVFTSTRHAVVGLNYTMPAPTVVAATSRLIHGAAEVFDIPLPLSGTAGIECRRGGATNDYQIVVTFGNSVAVNGTPQAQVTSGAAQIGSGGTANGGVVGASGNNVTIPLTNVANAQTIQVTLFGVSDGSGSGNVVIPISVLVGDVNGNGTVNATDVAACKSHIGELLNAANFRSDVSANGSINATDTAILKANIGSGLP